ncbi:AMSH-like ubiquitin thioesterase 3 [Tasmannia lanceolata]|uniref:AMSH-like ubiquitin thioesterase 3 n=1 Tax=Tasmannia lanceolata TaxID=3420 RepID=UPI004063E3AA
MNGNPNPMAININSYARKVDVDNRIPLHFYYRIADNLLKQASIYREEKNLLDLYVVLLRFTSLISETIPCHQDYQLSLLKERTKFRKKLLDAISELESLKPDAQRQLNEQNKAHVVQLDSLQRFSYNSATSPEWPYVTKQISSDPELKQLDTRGSASQSRRAHINELDQVVSPSTRQIDRQFRKLSLTLPHPKEETLNRHSILGPNGLRGQWQGPITGIRVHYPSNANLAPAEIFGQNQGGQCGLAALKDGESDRSTMESVLSLDDGRWLHPVEETRSQEAGVLINNIRQPSPPPVLARVHQDMIPISPSKVADPRPGPARPLQDGIPGSNTYQKLHIPPKMMEDFLRLAQKNTHKNLETCGVLAGSLKNRIFYITTLIIPKQESTSDSCQTMNEEEIFDVQEKLSLFPLGWIHTHPTQSCFMSSVDLHTHYSYQVMLPEAIAIVMAPTDESRTHGIFHLSDPGGVSVIRHCQQRGFHPHEELPDGGPIYEHCSHVYINPNLKFDVVDLR